MEEFIKNPNPTKDQHFMVDQVMLKRIYNSANIEPYESICEIGGGEGALTDYLVSGNNYVTVIEKDPYYANYLKEKYKDMKNVTVIEGDALDYDFTTYDRVVANLPYTITEPFLINLAQTGALGYDKNERNSTSNIKSITLVLSQNSTRKMVAPIQITDGKSKCQNSEFGLIGAICHSLVDVDIKCAIPSECFYPKPAVTSFLVNLTPKKKKTTVDRIMAAFLTDKKGMKPSINRVYNLMLHQGKAYKINKHKSQSISINTDCTSKVIGDKNIYDLTNDQVSTLIQDLIRNDQKNKARTSRASKYDDDPMEQYRIYKATGRLDRDLFDHNDYDDFDDDYDLDENFMPVKPVHVKEKYKRNYDYFYDMTRYDALLCRGLEYVDEVDLHNRLSGKNVIEFPEVRVKRITR